MYPLHLLMDIMGSLCFGTIINKAAMSTYMQIFVWIPAFIFLR